MDELTPALQRTYVVAIQLRERLGRRPTQQEIAEARGLRAKSTINVQLKRLEAMGLIERAYDTSDCLRV